ncbi:hypothetical protein ACSBR2_040195 [Camellia fascicularis]
MHGSRGCLGFCTKPVDEPSKGMKIQGQIVRKQSVSDDFWSTSTCEIDNSALQSHRSASTLSTNPPLDPHNSVGSMSNPTEFVNHGLLLWNQTRLQWTGNKRPENQPQIREPKLRCFNFNNLVYINVKYKVVIMRLYISIYASQIIGAKSFIVVLLVHDLAGHCHL